MDKFLTRCRLCKSTTSGMFDINQTGACETFPNSIIISEILQIEIAHKEGWPTRICQSCMKTLMAVRLLQQKVLTVQDFYTRLADMSGIVDTVTEEQEEKSLVVYMDKEPCAEEQLPQEEYITEETIEMDNNCEEEMIHEEVLEEDTLDTSVQFIHEDIEVPSEVQVNPHNPICLVVCSFCDDKFLNHNLLMVHKLQQHKEESVHQKSKVVIVYQEQSQEAEEGEEWSDPGTTNRHQKERTLTKSLSQFRVTKDYVCELCGDVHPNLVALKRHRRKVHEAPKQRERCTICGRFYMDLKVHYKMMHGKPKEVCPVCGVETLRLKWHMLVHEERRHRCEVCDNSFRTHYDVERHMRVHTGERVRCLFCPHMASHQDNSKTHMLKKHPEEYKNMLLEKRGLKGAEFTHVKEEEMLEEVAAGEWAEVQSE